MIDPTQIRLSRHFLLSDFMGNHTAYTYGRRNEFIDDALRLGNGRALCESALEPILAEHGPLSISYGYISPEMSREIVHYQDPNQPSHHRWDLGAAADICVHGWVNGDPDDDTIQTAPVALAHAIDCSGIPYSRLISYSESPYLCIAVRASELAADRPRKAFYENRYTGQRATKPAYYSRSTSAARARSANDLASGALRSGWRGAGYPTYHGGGRRQLHHVRVSKYTMLSDWLFNLHAIANGVTNAPNLGNPELMEMFYACGDAYDEIIDLCQVPRMSIIAGYVSPANPYFTRGNDWRSGTATFSLVPPEGMSADDVRLHLLFKRDARITGFGQHPDILDITVQL